MSKKYQNVEIKAVAKNFTNQQKIAETLSGKPPQILKQEDFYFNISKGRLKLRVLSIKKGQLIYYERPDEPGPKVSDYQIYETNTPNKLIEVLEMSYGIRNIVRKTRKLYIYKRTRIHMDSVDDLGEFIELEVIMGSNDDHLNGKEEALSLIDRLEITEEDLIHCSYIDLLESK
ncbi:MAG: class IV adenylate cyclase [Thermodesulfobacteriota bacterium]